MMVNSGTCHISGNFDVFVCVYILTQFADKKKVILGLTWLVLRREE